MGSADIDDHRYVRLADGGQVGHFPEMIHAHFQYRHLGILRHGQNGHGHADVVVVIHRGFGGTERPLQYGSDHFLGGAFAHGAGDAHHPETQPLPFAPGDISQGQPHVRHHNGGIVSLFVGTKHRRCSLFQGRRNKLMAVSGSLQCQKQLTGLQGSSIVAGPQESDLLVFLLHSAAAPKGRLFQRDLTHVRSSIPTGRIELLPVRPSGIYGH